MGVEGHRPPLTAVRGRWRLLVAGAAVVFLAVVAFGLGRPRPLGHDEATYAVGARALVGGDAVDGYPVYRPLAMPLLLAPQVALGGDDALVRLPFALGAAGYALLVAALAVRLGGRRAGTLALVAQLTAAPWLWRSCEALSDVPAAATLVAMALLVIDDGPRARGRVWSWLLVAALGAAAFYVRYGSAPTIAMLLGGALVAYPARWRAIVGAGALVALALAPFAWWSVATTGRLTGVLDLSAEMGWRPYPGAGLVYYLGHWFTTVAGPVMGAMALAGLVVGAAAFRSGPLTDEAAARRRAVRLLFVAAVGQLVLLGWRVHGEGRYVFFATSGLTAIGAAWLAARPRLAIVTAVALAVAAVPSALAAGWMLERLHDQRAGFVRAADIIAADRGARCLVLTGSPPQATWYTRCAARLGDRPPDDATLAAFDRVYVLVAPGQVRQPDVAALGRPGLRWEPVRCGDRPRWCVYRATRAP